MSLPQIKVKLDCVRATSNGSNIVSNAMIPVVATVTTSGNALGVTSVVISNTSTGSNSTTITHVPSSVITSGSIVKENLHHLQVQPQSQQQHSLSSTIVSSGTSVIHPIQSSTSKQPHIITSSSATSVGEHANTNSIIVTAKSATGSSGPVTFGSGVTSAFTSTNNIPLIACPVPLPSSSNNNSNAIINTHTYTLTNNNSNGNSSSGSSSGNNNGSNLCCLTEDGSRCSRVAGNASYSKRIQKTVQQKRLKLSIDSSARHIYICDHHKGKPTFPNITACVSESQRGQSHETVEKGPGASLLPLKLLTQKKPVSLGGAFFSFPSAPSCAILSIR